MSIYKRLAHSPTTKQLDFAEFAFKTMAEDNDKSKATVFPAQCGIGKSTTIKSLIYHCLFYDSIYSKDVYRNGACEGLIVVSDRIRRLDDYFQSDPRLKDHCYIISSHNDEPIHIQLSKQAYKPIVFLTTQRYFSLTKEEIQNLKNWFDYMHGIKTIRKRNYIIFDEKPYFYDRISIDVKNLNDIDSAIFKGIDSSDIATKTWICEEYRKLKNRLIDILDKTDKTDKTKDYYFLKPESETKSLTSDDEKFFKILNQNKYKNNLIEIYPNIFQDLECLKSIVSEGCFVVTTKSNKEANIKYSTQFLYLEDNRKRLINKGMPKVFIFDGTADIDPDYKRDYVKLANCNEFKRKLNLEINIKNAKTTKKMLRKNKETIEKIKEYVSFSPINTILTTHKSFIDSDVDTYFGNMKGHNHLIHYHDIVFIGIPRFQDIDYLFQYFSLNNEIYQNIQKMSIQDSREAIQNLIEINAKAIFNSDLINIIMFSNMLVEFEQTLYRTALRNYNDNDKVTCKCFWSITGHSPLNNLIQNRFEKIGAKIIIDDIDLFGVDKINTRKTKNSTAPQKILKWFELQPKGRVFKTSELLAETGINKMQYKNAKKIV